MDWAVGYDSPWKIPWRTTYLPSDRGLYEASIVPHEILGSVYYGLVGWR